jgi:beta-lactamase class A
MQMSRQNFGARRAARIAAGTVFLLALAATSCVSINPELRVAPSDHRLEREISRIVARAHCRFGIWALHIESGRRLELNAEKTFESASIIKIAVLAEAIARSEAGTFNLEDRWTLTDRAKAAGSGILAEFEPGLNPTYLDVARLMIIISDNTAANSLIDRFGRDAINARMESLGLPGIRLVGRIPDREPVETEHERWKGLHLGEVTPHDVGEYFRRVAEGDLLDAAGTHLIQEIYARQHYRNRLPARLLGKPGTSWAGKTGTMSGVRTDAGYLTSPKGRFVLVAFADRIDEDNSDAVGRALAAMAEIGEAIVTEWGKTLPDLPPAAAPIVEK